VASSWDRFRVYLAIGDSHLREVESLILRIVKPPGNKQKRKFAKSEDLRRRFKRDWQLEMRLKLSDLRGRQLRPAPQNRKAVEADGRQPVLGAGVLRRVYDCFTYFTSLFTTLIWLAQQDFRVMVRRRLGERPWSRESTILRSEPGVGFRANGGGGGNRTRVPGKQTSRDYMLSPERVFCRAMASELESRGLVRMEFSRPTARGLRLQPCLLWRSSGVAGVHRRTSRHIRPRELIVR